MILTIDDVNDLLDEMAEGFPAILFDGLNGGVNLLEEALPDPEFPEGEMYILGVLRGLPGAVHQSLLRLICRSGEKGGLGRGDLAGGAGNHPLP